MKLPSFFAQRMRALLANEYEAFEAALAFDPVVSVRFNRGKVEEWPPHVEVPWCADACYLPQRPVFTADPLLHAGAYYVQEASSMFLARVLGQYVTEPVVALDLCAAPGGKATLLCAALPEGSLVVANEVIRPRAHVLAENIIKWGSPNVVVSNDDPARFAALGGLFDVLLADVPCSGEGMFRKDEQAVNEWSDDHVALCAARSRRIVADVWPALKEGGLMVYSTCTYNTEENERNVAWIASELGAEVLPVGVEPAWHVTGNLAGMDFPVYRFLPHHTQGEGLFMAVLRKTSAAPTRSLKCPRMSGKTRRPIWVAYPDQYAVVEHDGECLACLNAYWAHYACLREHLHLLHAGIGLALVKGTDLVPSHALAMSTALQPDAFPRVELPYGQAMAYLRKEAIGVDAPKGYVLVTYRGVPLGFVKNMGTRANNLYPREWRIRNNNLQTTYDLWEKTN